MIAGVPVSSCQSRALTEAASAATRTCPGRSSGSATSSRRIFSGPPHSSRTMARMRLLEDGRVGWSQVSAGGGRCERTEPRATSASSRSTRTRAPGSRGPSHAASTAGFRELHLLGRECDGIESSPRRVARTAASTVSRDRRFEPPRKAARACHGRRNLRECGSDVTRDGASLESAREHTSRAQAVGEPRKRRRHVRVGRADRGLDRVGRGRAVESPVCGAAIERRRPRVGWRGARGVAVESAEVVAVALAVAPRLAERPRLSTETARPDSASEGGMVPQEPDPAVEHEARRRHPGEERDLRVPGGDRQRRPTLEANAVTVGHHDGPREWRDSRPRARSRPPARPHRRRRAGAGLAVGVRGRLRLVCTSTGAGLRIRRGARARIATLVGADAQVPDEGGSIFAGEERRDALADLDGCRGDPARRGA